MGLFSNKKIIGNELQKCLTYYESCLKVTVFQTKEADLFNNTLVKYLNAIGENSEAAREICSAAQRLVQSAKEVIKRHEEIKPIPEIAYLYYQAWRETYLAHLEWADATLFAMESLAEGMTPHYQYVQSLLNQCNSLASKAQLEGSKFLKRLDVPSYIINEIISRCNTIKEGDSWQPEPSLYESSVDVNSIIPIIGSDIEWIQIVNHVFRVLQFDRHGTTIGTDDTVIASSPDEPYGYLLVESPILNQPAILPITHRDEFILASSVFDDPQWLEIIEKEELLVTYVPKKMLPNGLVADMLLGLHFVITPRGTLDKYYKVGNDMYMANPTPEKLFGSFIWEGEVRVQINSHLILSE